jgi:YfiH family protein
MLKSDVMNIHQKEDVIYLSFKIFDDIDFINTAVSTRYGGVSKGETFSSMNLGTSTKDNWDDVVKNYNIFCDAAGFDVKRLVLAKQTHTANVLKVDESYAGCGVLRERFYTDIDALITNQKNLPLVIHTADCVPVVFADIKNKAIGNAHCGWRGTYGCLAKETLKAMHENYGTKPEDVIVTIGPCICVDCYEVSKELYEDFLKKFGYSDYILNKDEKYYLNLPMINRQILIDMGVPSNNIAVSDICTCCECKHLYSHRGLGPERGIFANIISIN